MLLSPGAASCWWGRHIQSCVVAGVQNTLEWCRGHPSAVTLSDTHSRLLPLNIDLNVCSDIILSVNICESLLWIFLDIFTSVVVDTFLRSDAPFMTAVLDTWKHSVKTSHSIRTFCSSQTPTFSHCSLSCSFN